MTNKTKFFAGNFSLEKGFSKFMPKTFVAQRIKRIIGGYKIVFFQTLLSRRTLATISILLICVIMFPSCKGRKIRAELVTLAKAIEGSRDASNAIAQKIEELEYSSPKENEEFIQEVDDLIGQINTLVEPIQTLQFETMEVGEVRDLYITAWGSLRDALGLINELLKNKDEKLAQSFSDKLSLKLKVYNDSIFAFQQKYKAMLEKYGVTSEDIGPLPLKPAVTPSPFSPSASP